MNDPDEMMANQSDARRRQSRCFRCIADARRTISSIPLERALDLIVPEDHECPVFSWEGYVAWTHETAMRRVPRDAAEELLIGRADDRERAELMEIWGLGLGGEFLEFLVEAVDEDDEGPFVERSFSEKGKEEVGDCVYYLARLYADCGHVKSDAWWGREFLEFKDVVRRVKDVVEAVKKALRREGRQGLVRLTVPESSGGRRGEFGVLLDEALAGLEGMIEEFGSSLAEVCEVNRAKLERRRAEGTVGEQGKMEEA